MNTIQHRFPVTGPVDLHVENGKGRVEVTTAEVAEASVELDGPDAEATVVSLDGDRLTITPPRHSGFLASMGRELHIRVVAPLDSDLAAKLGSSDLAARGRYGDVLVRSGSGDVTIDDARGDASVETGSGDLRITRAGADLRIKSGSGDVVLGEVVGEAAVSTGSGDVSIDSCAAGMAVKTGSGDLTLGRAEQGFGFATGSGDTEVGAVARGRVSVKGASGDVRIGVPGGVPVWTDVSTVTGRVRSTLQSAGEPEPGADYVELRAKTVSGDIELVQR